MEETREWLKTRKTNGIPIYGRICSGPDPKNHDAPLISFSYKRETTFLFGEDGLDLLLDESCTGFSFLLKLGFKERYICHDILDLNIAQKLILFQRTVDCDSFPVVPATWGGVAHFIDTYYPLVKEDYDLFRHELHNTAFPDIEKQAGFSFFEVLKDIDTTRQKLDYETYCSLPKPRKLWQFRFFLYCEFRLLELFNGDGYTLVEGIPGGHLREYLCKNVELSYLRERADVWEITLPVVIPDNVHDKYYP